MTSKLTSFLESASEGNVQNLSQNVLEGVDINSSNNDGWTALMFAAWKNKKDAVKFLLDNGANPNLADFSGYSLLQIAARYADPNIVSMFIEIGLDVNGLSWNDESPLISAILGKKIDNFELLLSCGADPHAKTEDGFSALHLARERQLNNICTKLINLGVK